VSKELEEIEIIGLVQSELKREGRIKS